MGRKFRLSQFRKRTPWRVFWATLVCYGLVQFWLSSNQDYPSEDYQTLDRLIGSTVYLDVAAAVQPSWKNAVALYARGQQYEALSSQVRYAERNEFLPPALCDTMALAAHYFGEDADARAWLEKASGDDVTNRLTRAVILGESPAAEDLAAAEAYIEDGVADWQIYYQLGQLQDDEACREDMVASGGYLYDRTFDASLVLNALFLWGLCCIPVLIKTKPEPDRFRLPAEWHVARLLTVFFAAFVLSNLVSMATGYLPAWTVLGWLFVYTLTYVAYLGLPVWLLAHKFSPGVGASIRLFGLVKPRLPDVRVVQIGLATFAISWALGYVQGLVELELSVLDVRDWLQLETLDSYAALTATLIAAVVIAPVCEEFLYRGFLFRGLQNRFGPWVSALISSAIFATYHWYSPAGWVSVFMFGMLLCWVTRRCGTLWPCIIAHALYNLVLTQLVWAGFSFV